MPLPSRIALTLLLLCGWWQAAWAESADALWHIVHDRCAPNEAAHGNPAPCALVDYPGGEASGYAILKDRNGDTQFLLMPTARIAGIEDPAILAPAATNYWQAAWEARSEMLARVGHVLPRDAISLAINSPFARSQNQLHIHIDCLRADVRDVLRDTIDRIGPSWAPLPVPLAGHPYRARRLDAFDLAFSDPFRLLAASPDLGPAGIGGHTLVVVGAGLPDGREGFVLLDDRADPATGDRAHGEELQDHACAVARSLAN